MKGNLHSLMLLSLCMLTMAKEAGITTKGLNGYESSNPYKENNTPEAKGLKLYSCNGIKFFAHNEREVIKRAKQRGLWKEGVKIVLA